MFFSCPLAVAYLHQLYTLDFGFWIFSLLSFFQIVFLLIQFLSFLCMPSSPIDFIFLCFSLRVTIELFFFHPTVLVTWFYLKSHRMKQLWFGYPMVVKKV